MLSADFLHYLSPALAIGLSAIGNGIGQGLVGTGGLEAIHRQEKSTEAVTRAMFLGLSLVESGTILSLVIALFLLFSGVHPTTLPISIAELGMGLAIGLSAAAISIASSVSVSAACQSIAHQPFFAQKIITLMLIAQSIIEAPVIFVFVITLLIKTHINDALTIAEGIKLLAAGLAMSVGTIGPSIGQAIFAHASCTAAGLNTKVFNKIFTFSLLSQAVIETPVIFSLVISILLVFKPTIIINPLFAVAAFVTPALVVSVGSMGTAIATGFAASRNATPIALKPDYSQVFTRASLIAQVIIESSAIYALIVALILMTKTF